MNAGMQRASIMIAIGLLANLTAPAHATWSIVIGDRQTGEVAVGTVTCLNNFDLLAIVPVVVVGRGTAAVQASGDFNGIRRPVIFSGFMAGTPPQTILISLAGISGHQSRQYGIVNTNGQALTFSGASTLAWSGGIVGSVGTMDYAIQGNVLAGGCVVPAIELAVINTPGDMAEKLMAGMEAASAAGGDGRCSCNPNAPASCGCPNKATKSGHIGGMIVARIGDIDDTLCSAAGCADGTYFMRLNVAFQPSNAADPVSQLRAQFNNWRAQLSFKPDAIQSTVGFSPSRVPPNGAATTTMIVTLLDYLARPAVLPVQSVTVAHAATSAGVSSIGPVVNQGAGVYSVELTAGNAPGIDRFEVLVDFLPRPVILMPEPSLAYTPLGDIDGDGDIDSMDQVAFVALLLGTPLLPEHTGLADLNGDGAENGRDIPEFVAARLP